MLEAATSMGGPGDSAPMAIRRIDDGVELTFGPQVRLELRDGQDQAWCYLNASPRPCFNPALLREIDAAHDFLASGQGVVSLLGMPYRIKYLIYVSETPRVYSLGGDLALFLDLIARNDRQGLLDYGMASLRTCFFNLRKDPFLTTVSLVQGDCFGGGFEAALSTDLLVAERSSRFSFPEIRFNLFPGVGAYSILLRKVGHRQAYELLSRGDRYSAEDMLNLGIVHRVAGDGQGKAAVAALLEERALAGNCLDGLAATVRRVHALEFQELADVVEIWADAAFRLRPADLDVIRGLVAKQTELARATRLPSP